MKKGFTLVELLGVIVIVAILSGLAIVSVTAIVNNSKNGVYKNYESTLESSARNYLIEYPEKTPGINGSIKLDYQMLHTAGILNQMSDPNGGNCNNSYVLITRSADKDNINMDINYQVCLICNKYRSTGC